MNPLDNPIWYALNTVHHPFSQGARFAKTYPLAMSPLGGLGEVSALAYQDLSSLVYPDHPVALFLEEPANPPIQDWEIARALVMSQMVCEQLNVPSSEKFSIETLTPKDVPAMLDLVAQTQPGPFSERTIEMGHYYGIRQSGSLVAMAGERLQLPAHTEVSAVCTHPDYRGHGFAAALVAHVAQGILSRGKTPFLHVKDDNLSAISVYERLGFTHRRPLHLGVLHPILSRAIDKNP